MYARFFKLCANEINDSQTDRVSEKIFFYALSLVLRWGFS